MATIIHEAIANNTAMHVQNRIFCIRSVIWADILSHLKGKTNVLPLQGYVYLLIRNVTKTEA